MPRSFFIWRGGVRNFFGFKSQTNYEPRRLKDSEILAAPQKIVKIFMNPPPPKDNVNSTFSLKVGQKTQYITNGELSKLSQEVPRM